MRRLNISIWHIHGAYLTAITQAAHNWYLPVKPGVPEGYCGRGENSSMPDYVREVLAEDVRNLDLDLVICQTPQNCQADRFEILSPEQRQLPTIYLEHNTPEPHPTDSKHPATDDPGVTPVHVTNYNRLMWDNGQTLTRVVKHSVTIDPTIRYTGQRREGLGAVNERRGRMAGFDLFVQFKQQLPLTVAGMKSAEIGGIGEIHYTRLHQTVAQYRFLFIPMRYSSLPLAVIEARSMGDSARELALRDFGLPRFVDDWNSVFREALSGAPKEFSVNEAAY